MMNNYDPIRSNDPTQPIAPPTNLWLLGLLAPINETWRRIRALIQSEVEADVKAELALANGMTNVAVTMGTPGLPLMASGTAWAMIVVPFSANIQRIEYFAAPDNGTFSVDVKIVRPGQAMSAASSFYLVAPPTLTDIATRLITEGGYQGYIEPGTILLFYVTSASICELVTANVIMRTIG